MTNLTKPNETDFKELLERKMLKFLDDFGAKYGINGWEDQDLPHLLPVFHKQAEILIARIKELSPSYSEWIKL